jgi:predicted negative regulator of RcsB-dependent stress response
MSEIVDFIKENFKMIILIVIVVLLLLVFINIKGIDLNEPKPESKLVQEVTVETFEQNSMQDSQENIEKMKLNMSNSFCESYLGNSQELEGACNQLTKTNCAQTSCCVFTNNKDSSKCVAGGIHGPTYKTDKDGKLITMDSYYYLGVRH